MEDLLPAASSLFKYGGFQYFEAINSFTADGVARRLRSESSSSTFGDPRFAGPDCLGRFVDVRGVTGISTDAFIFGFLVEGPASALGRGLMVELTALWRSTCSGILLSSSDDPDVDGAVTWSLVFAFLSPFTAALLPRGFDTGGRLGEGLAWVLAESCDSVCSDSMAGAVVAESMVSTDCVGTSSSCFLSSSTEDVDTSGNDEVGREGALEDGTKTASFFRFFSWPERLLLASFLALLARLKAARSAFLFRLSSRKICLLLGVASCAWLVVGSSSESDSDCGSTRACVDGLSFG